jgi:hypothetical protein
MLTHECDGCGVESRSTECLCPSCLEEKEQKAHDEGYEEARKEFEVKE